MNKEIIKKLSDWDCDTQGALNRLLNDESCYIYCLKMTLNELRDLSELTRAIDSGNLKRAFEIAHYHKGSLGNLGLTPLYNAICDLTELLRSGSVDGATQMIDKIKLDVEELNKIISSESDN